MRMLLGMRSEQAAPSPRPPWPTPEQEKPEKSSISNTPTAMVPKVWVKGSLHLRPFLPPNGTAVATALEPGRISALRPSHHGCGHSACTSPWTGRPSRSSRRSRWPSSAFAAPHPGGRPAAAAGAQCRRRWHRQEPSNGAIDFIHTHAKYGFGGHGAGSAVAESVREKRVQQPAAPFGPRPICTEAQPALSLTLAARDRAHLSLSSSHSAASRSPHPLPLVLSLAPAARSNLLPLAASQPSADALSPSPQHLVSLLEPEEEPRTRFPSADLLLAPMASPPVKLHRRRPESSAPPCLLPSAGPTSMAAAPPSAAPGRSPIGLLAAVAPLPSPATPLQLLPPPPRLGPALAAPCSLLQVLLRPELRCD
nr:centriole proteome protein 16-like [Aegilops tauschii subsp. strangulata]